MSEALAAATRLSTKRDLKLSREQFSNELFQAFDKHRDKLRQRHPVQHGVSYVQFVVDAFPVVPLDDKYKIALRKLRPLTHLEQIPLRIEVAKLATYDDLFTAQGERLGGWDSNKYGNHGLFTPLGELQTQEDLNDLLCLTNLVLDAAGVAVITL